MRWRGLRRRGSRRRACLARRKAEQVLPDCYRVFFTRKQLGYLAGSWCVDGHINLREGEETNMSTGATITEVGWRAGRQKRKGWGEIRETDVTERMPSREWRCDTYLVGLDSCNLLVGLDCVTDLLLPSLECAFRDGLGHLWHLDGLICSQRKITSVTTSRYYLRAVETPYPLAVLWYGRGHGMQVPCNVHLVSGQPSVMCV